MATGFGRTGTLFASEQCGVRPDLLCLGKGITGGYLAMSATVASGEVFDAFLGADLGPETFYHGHSYGGNALAAAVALEHLRLDRGVGRAGERAGAAPTSCRRCWPSASPARPEVREVRQRGLMVGRRAGAARARPALGPPGVRRRGRAGASCCGRSATSSCSCRR